MDGELIELPNVAQIPLVIIFQKRGERITKAISNQSISVF